MDMAVADKTEKAKALQAALAQIEKQFGKGTIMRLGEGEVVADIQVVSTGSLGLDVALGVGGKTLGLRRLLRQRPHPGGVIGQRQDHIAHVRCPSWLSASYTGAITALMIHNSNKPSSAVSATRRRSCGRVRRTGFMGIPGCWAAARRSGGLYCGGL